MVRGVGGLNIAGERIRDARYTRSQGLPTRTLLVPLNRGLWSLIVVIYRV